MENNELLDGDLISTNNNISNIMNRKQKIVALEQLFKKENPKKRLTYQGDYTNAFKTFNMNLLKQGKTQTVAFSNNKLFDVNTNRLLNKGNYLTQKGKPRKKYSNTNDFQFNGDVFNSLEKYRNPIEKRLREAEAKNEKFITRIDFDRMNNNLDNLLTILRPTTQQYRLRVDYGGEERFFTLNSNTLQELRQLISQGQVITEEEDIDSKTTILRSWFLRRPFDLIRSKKSNKTGKGQVAFFGYNHKLEKVDLSRYGVFSVEQELVDDDKYKNPCLIDALELAGLDTQPLKTIVRNRHIPHKDLGKVAELLDIHLVLRYITDEKKRNYYGDKTKKKIEIGNICNHCFLIEETNYTRFSIENYDKVKELKDFNRISEIDKNGKFKRKKGRFLDSYKLIKLFFIKGQKQNSKGKMVDDYKPNLNMLQPITYHNALYKTIFHNDVEDFGSLEYNQDINLKENEVKNKTNTVFHTIYYDFETTTSNLSGDDRQHRPYLVFTNESENGYYGEDCGKQLLNDLVNKYGTDKDTGKTKTIVNKKGEEKEVPLLSEVLKHKHQLRLIAHNGGYDFRFIMKYLYKIDTIEKNNSLMNGNALAFYGNKVLSINLRDSLKMINMGLGKFGKAFGLSVQKEIMPYNLYTVEAVNKKFIPKKYCIKACEEAKLDVDEYLKNCEKWDCFVGDNIDIIKYSAKYCYMDCITLQKGYEKFAELVKEGCKLDIRDYISLASMSNDYLLRQGCYEDVNMISGVPRHFIQKCVVGGRTMTAQNKKWIKRDCNISDFDQTSLYPSSEFRMDGFLKGSPKVIKNFEPEKYDGYFIQILITNVKKKYNFPLASYLNKKGIRCFTNDLVGKCIFMDKTGLEDLVNFQGVEYQFIRGYYYDEGRNPKIKETMRHLFTQRVKFKKRVYIKNSDNKIIAEYENKEIWKNSIHKNHNIDLIQFGNPVQMVFKELMNSSYGKTFMKPIDCELEYIHKDKLEEYVERHFNQIKCMYPLCDNRTIKIEKIKTIDTHFNNVPCGVEILSMSKRIMNEVMCLAEDNKLPIYITDTDSIHIDTECVPILAEKFKEKYHRELIGEDMGQAHTDFDLDGSKGEIIATDCVFLGKKVYIDKLKSKDKNGNDIIGYHIRMKGVPEDCIRHKADTEYDGDLIRLYEDLYYERYTGSGDKSINSFDGDKRGLSFNLLACRPKFEYKKNMTIVSRNEFMRRVKFDSEKGELLYS